MSIPLRRATSASDNRWCLRADFKAAASSSIMNNSGCGMGFLYSPLATSDSSDGRSRWNFSRVRFVRTLSFGM
ncbi:MAG: hypothetical protein MUF06_17620 [Pirellulaceae bacterium]|nr:hypothetical protein [Pirellulaceae bacterium]